MEAPIKVAFAEAKGYQQFMAFASPDLTKNGKAGEKHKAIVEALVAAGAIEIIDLDNPPPALVPAAEPITVPAAL